MELNIYEAVSPNSTSASLCSCLSYPASKAHLPYAELYFRACFVCRYHAISQMARYWEKVIEQKICFDFLYKVCLKQFSF